MQRSSRFLSISVAALALALIPAAALAATLPKLAAGGGSSRFSVRPHFVQLSADGALYLGGSRKSGKIGPISWRRWSSSAARGNGYLWVDNCKPDCASGKFTGHKVGISASSVSGGDFQKVKLSCTVSKRSRSDTLTLLKASGKVYYWEFNKLACEKA